MKNCTDECGNKFTTLESFHTNMLSVLTAYYGHYRLEQYFKSKGSVIDSQLHHFKNCILINDSENGELYGNTNVMQLKNCIDEYENKFTRKQCNLVCGRHFATFQVLFGRIYPAID
jgi:transcriptional regulator NrdR family protein